MSEEAARVVSERVGKVALLTVDNPPVNATSHALRSALKNALDAALGDPAVEAVAVMGAGRGFIAGADISEFDRTRLEPLNPTIIAAMENASKPVIAAIHGHALGGGLELAMGCHWRIATQTARFGQPEVKIGLTPGAGGTQRLPRLVGLERALAMIAGGDPIDAAEATRLGLIDAFVSDDLRNEALAFAERAIAERRPLRRVRDLPPPALPDLDFFARARADLLMRKPALTAPQRCIDALEASQLPFADGLKREAEIFATTVSSEQSKALRYLFFAERDAGKSAFLPASVEPRAVESVAVIGAGTMGSAIAACFLDAGLPVTVIEESGAALERGLAAVRSHLAASARRAATAPAELERRLARLTGAAKLDGAAGAGLVIEAVFEDVELKRKVFAALGAVAKPDAVLATNTSYCDVEKIADAARDPANIVGMHFFSPATLMRAVEVVRAARSSPIALATAMAAARKIRKLPVLVGACHGFAGNRLLARRGEAAERLVLEGAPMAEIDAAMVEFGFPIGPFAASDLAGIDIGERARRARGIVWPLASAFADSGRLGQKTGAGYYRYEKESRAPQPDPDAERLVAEVRRRHGAAATATIPSRDAIVARLVGAMVEEGEKIVAEGIVERASDLDVVWVYGFGWPAYRGGPMFHGRRETAGP